MSDISPASALEVGAMWSVGPATMEGADARTVVDLCGYTHPMFAGSGPPQIIPGQLVLAMAAGLLESSGRMGEEVKALLGLDDVRFTGPLAPGAPLSVDVEVLNRRSTSRGDSEVVTLSLELRSDSDTIGTARATFLVGDPPLAHS